MDRFGYGGECRLLDGCRAYRSYYTGETGGDADNDIGAIEGNRRGGICRIGLYERPYDRSRCLGQRHGVILQLYELTRDIHRVSRHRRVLERLDRQLPFVNLGLVSNDSHGRYGLHGAILDQSGFAIRVRRDVDSRDVFSDCAYLFVRIDVFALRIFVLVVCGDSSYTWVHGVGWNAENERCGC